MHYSAVFVRDRMRNGTREGGQIIYHRPSVDTFVLDMGHEDYDQDYPFRASNWYDWLTSINVHNPNRFWDKIQRLRILSPGHWWRSRYQSLRQSLDSMVHVEDVQFVYVRALRTRRLVDRSYREWVNNEFKRVKTTKEGIERSFGERSDARSVVVTIVWASVQQERWNREDCSVSEVLHGEPPLLCEDESSSDDTMASFVSHISHSQP